MKREDELVVGQTELAAQFRVSRRTIIDWETKGLRRARVGTQARYNLAEAIAWRVEQARGTGPDAKEAAVLRRLEADARRVELEVQQVEGQLIPLALHTSRLAGILDRLRARLSAAPGAWAPQLVGLKSVPDALKRARELVNELLAALNAAAEEIIPDDDDAGDSRAA